MMNGTGDHVSVADAGGPPIVTINQINLTGKQIVSIGSMLIGAIMSAYAAGWLFLPAKQKEFEALNKVVVVMQQQLDESRQAINRLTLAVDNMSGIVSGFKNSASVPMPRAKGR
jgi:hypothetical protein